MSNVYTLTREQLIYLVELGWGMSNKGHNAEYNTFSIEDLMADFTEIVEEFLTKEKLE